MKIQEYNVPDFPYKQNGGSVAGGFHQVFSPNSQLDCELLRLTEVVIIYRGAAAASKYCCFFSPLSCQSSKWGIILDISTALYLEYFIQELKVHLP